ncbi:hypothetical protein Hanom_Chr17g01590431 [Helianthus anomalus]
MANKCRQNQSVQSEVNNYEKKRCSRVKEMCVSQKKYAHNRPNKVC